MQFTGRMQDNCPAAAHQLLIVRIAGITNSLETILFGFSPHLVSLHFRTLFSRPFRLHTTSFPGVK